MPDAHRAELFKTVFRQAGYAVACLHTGMACRGEQATQQAENWHTAYDSETDSKQKKRCFDGRMKVFQRLDRELRLDLDSYEKRVASIRAASENSVTEGLEHAVTDFDALAASIRLAADQRLTLAQERG